MQRQGDCPQAVCGVFSPGAARLSSRGSLYLAPGTSRRERGVSEEMFGVHAINHTLFVDHSGIIKTCDLFSLSSLGRGTATMHQMHLCSEHIIPNPHLLGAWRVSSFLRHVLLPVHRRGN